MNTVNDPSIIHETVIRDIISMIVDSPKSMEHLRDNLSKNAKFSYRNIARASRDLTLTFPVIVSDGVSVEAASMICKAIERKAVTMLQMLFSAIQITNADNALDYLKKFHNNINPDENMGVDDWISFGNVLATREDATSNFLEYDLDYFSEEVDTMEYLPKDDPGFTVVDHELFAEAVKQFKEFGEFYLEESYNDGLGRFMVDMAHGNRVTVTNKRIVNENDIIVPQSYNRPDEEEEKKDLIDKGVGAINTVSNGLNNANAKINSLPGIRHINSTVGKVAGATLGATAATGGAKWLANKIAPDSSATRILTASNNLAKKPVELVQKVNPLNRISARTFMTNGMKNKLAGGLNSLRNQGYVGRKAAKLGLGLSKMKASTALGGLGMAAAIAGLASMGANMYNDARKDKDNDVAQPEYALEQHRANVQDALNILHEADLKDVQSGAQIAGNVANILNNIGSAYSGRSKNQANIAKNLSDVEKNTAEVFSKQIIPTDIQKANEMIPTMMIINFVSGSDSGAPIKSQAVIGVKARLQYVSSRDMMQRLVAKNEDKNGLFKFIKATTGQISFWKDFIFAIDKAKLDSISNSGRGSSSPVWKILERRARLSKFKRWTGSINDAAAISTLVISKEEIDFIKKNDKIDFNRPTAVHNIMNGYNIMGFVIVDESLEKAQFLFDDGSNSYETTSFSHLERQGNDGGAYKKVINLLTKSR